MANNAPLVVFRILFGLLMAIESFGAIGTGWVQRTFVAPKFTFTIVVGGWPQLVGPGMYGWFVAMGGAALAVMVGWRYRWSSALLATLWTGAYLAQKTSYNNHYYLAVLVCWAMVLLPADRRASIDVAAGRTARSEHCPAWIAQAFKLQVGIVYTYAAIAKLYPDWIDGRFLTVLFESRSGHPVIAWLLQPPLPVIIALGGIAFDAVIVPLLAWRPTRSLAFAGLVFFNLFNSAVFLIGIFPYLALALTVFFFAPERVERRFGFVPGLGRAGTAPKAKRAPPALEALLAAYFAAQILLPLRHHLLDGDVVWTDEGHRMRWGMMLRMKQGRLTIVVRDPDSGTRETVDLDRWLTPKQARRVAVHPDMLFQLVQLLKAHYAAEGRVNVEIYARGRVSLNGHPAVPLFDPRVDLAKADFPRLSRTPWVLDRPRSP